MPAARPAHLSWSLRPAGQNRPGAAPERPVAAAEQSSLPPAGQTLEELSLLVGALAAQVLAAQAANQRREVVVRLVSLQPVAPATSAAVANRGIAPTLQSTWQAGIRTVVSLFPRHVAWSKTRAPA